MARASPPSSMSSGFTSVGESNYRDSHMAAYRQEVRKLKEKFNDFELHHIRRRDNEAITPSGRIRAGPIQVIHLTQRG
jgi:hypothetical protein